MKINKFLESVFSLVLSQIFIKLFGTLYSLYLTNKTGFGDEGNAIYMSGYQIYAILLTLSSIGVPNAISKLISEKNSIGDYKNEERVLKSSLFIFAIVGFFGTCLLYFFSDIISEKLLQIPESSLSLKILSPSIFFVSIISVMRGYFNGIGKISITAKSQTYEQLIKSCLTIFLAETTSRVSNYNTESMASVANLATTIAIFISLLYICMQYKNEKSIELKNNFKIEGIYYIIRRILYISFPITISTLLGNLGKNIDSITIVRLLKNVLGEETAKRKYGILSSKIDTLTNIPLSFNAAISTALVPEISKKNAQNDVDSIKEKIDFSINTTIIFGIPCSFGLYFFSERIFEILFSNANQGYEILKIASFGIVFSLLIQTLSGILQGLGKTKTLIISSFSGLIAKIIFNILLIPVQNIYEKGAILSNIFSNIISLVILQISLKKCIKLKLGIIRKSIKPIIFSYIMIKISDKIYYYLLLILPNKFCIIVSIIFAVVIYVIFLYIFLLKNEMTKYLKNKEKMNI